MIVLLLHCHFTYYYFTITEKVSAKDLLASLMSGFDREKEAHLAQIRSGDDQVNVNMCGISWKYNLLRAGLTLPHVQYVVLLLGNEITKRIFG